MATTSIPRFLFPQGSLISRNQLLFLHRNLTQIRQTPSTCRHVTGSSTARSGRAPPESQRVLEKPTKFNPPSHGRRLKAQIPCNYGPQLTQAQRNVQRTKQYPNMFPPEGTFMFWFLTNRSIHLWITLGTLASLCAFVAFENWRKDTPFRHSLPSKADLWAHPIISIKKAWRLLQQSEQENGMWVDAKRKDEVNDVHKRNTYRKAHGIEDKQGIGPWMPAEEKLKIWREKKAGDEVQVIQEEIEAKRKRPSRAILGISWKN